MFSKIPIFVTPLIIPVSHISKLILNNLMAPEMLKFKSNEACDLWSLGVMTFELLHGYSPFEGQDMLTTFKVSLFMLDFYDFLSNGHIL